MESRKSPRPSPRGMRPLRARMVASAVSRIVILRLIKTNFLPPGPLEAQVQSLIVTEIRGKVGGLCGFSGSALGARRDVMEADQVDILARAVLRHFQQVDDAEEARLARQLRRDIRIADGRDGIDLDFAFFHAVAIAGFHVRALPNAHAAGDFSAANSLAQALGEDHEESLARSRKRIFTAETPRR